MGVGTGRNELQVPIPAAFPKPPDIALLGQVPGGLLVPCQPLEAHAFPMLNRHNYALKFEGTSAAVKRIALQLPVLLVEDAVEESTIEEIENRHFASETERNSEGTRLAGESGETKTAQGFATQYERSAWILAAKAEGATTLKVTRSTLVQRSLLPLTMQVVVRLNESDGNSLFSQSFDVPVRFAGTGAPGHATGVGLLEQYIDLVNELAIDCEKTYGLEVLVLVPASVASSPSVGVILVGGVEKTGQGGVTFFYDLETGPPSK